MLQRPGEQAAAFGQRVILTWRNDQVAEFNGYLIDQMAGQLQTSLAADTSDINQNEEQHDELPVEYLHSLSLSGLPPAQLQLKLGAPVILLRNLDPKQGLYNDTRLTLTRLGQRCLKGQILTRSFAAQRKLLPRIKLTTTEGEYPFVLSRKQFPIRLCFAMTVNKAQEQSLSTVGVDLQTSAFTHGQLYVALSRVTDVTRLSVFFHPDYVQQTTANVVYPEVLLR